MFFKFSKYSNIDAGVFIPIFIFSLNNTVFVSMRLDYFKIFAHLQFNVCCYV